jgi:hypothetical protein
LANGYVIFYAFASSRFASFDLIAILTNQHATQEEISLDP